MLAQQTPASFPIDRAAEILGVQPSRFRASWRQNGVISPVLTRGLYHVSRSDVIRGAVLLGIQQAIGIQNPLAIELSKQLSDEHLESLIRADDPHITVIHPNGQRSMIGLDPEHLAQVREQLERR